MLCFKDPLHSKNVFFLYLCLLKCQTSTIVACNCATKFVTKEMCTYSSTEGGDV